MIKLLLKIDSNFLSRKIRSSLKVWALKVDINLLNQHCKPADWLTDWLTDWLRHLGIQCTQGTRVLEHLGFKALEGHLGTRALKALGHLDTWGTWALEGHVGTQALKTLGHSGTWALGHSKGTWALGQLGTRGTRGTLFSKLTKFYQNIWILLQS